MKKLLFIVVLFSSVLKAQVNSYFANNPTWLCYYEAYPWPCDKVDSLNYYIGGDTILNTLTYKKLIIRGHHIETTLGPPSPYCTPSNYTYNGPQPTGFMRSQGMQMYYMPFGDSTEYLLYDFNLSIGSHLPLTYVNTDTSYTVTFIDSIYTSAGYRERYFLNGGNTEYLVEGVGSSAGLLYPLGVLFESNAHLICYSQNDSAWFPGQGPACSVITGTVADEGSVAWTMTPNPAHEYLQVSGDLLKDATFIVRDLYGRKIKEQAVNEMIFIGDLPSGAYTCIVQSGEFQSSKLLIVQ